MNLEVFGKRLRFERQNRGLTQVALAERVGVESAVISKYERTGSLPRLEVLIKICQELKCSMDYLLGLSNVRNLPENIDESPTIKVLLALWGDANIPKAKKLEIEDKLRSYFSYLLSETFQRPHGAK